MLPVTSVLPDLRAALAQARCAVLEAPPGAGKTTAVPPALLHETWLAGKKILMLEPRRLAAKNAARFMATARGEAVGATVGYRVRLDTRVGPSTRIEVVTEGVLTRLLQDDPALENIGLVIFDEFHERSLHADLGLALTLDARANLRDDLRVLVMSATLDGARVAALLDDAPLVRTAGRLHAVATRYAPLAAGENVALAVARHALALMAEERGSLLAFLPGTGEIRRAAEWLGERLPPDIELAPLYGDLAPAEQDRAVRAAPAGRRKLVLATNIAESSLTIDCVRLVLDSGLERAPQFDPASAMTRLVTRRISQASAEQRRGRAGRTEAGVCLRLWREAETSRLAPHAAPEMLDADLAPLALELAGWGVRDPAALRWLDLPPAAAFAQARELLRSLHALDDDGRITPVGREMLALPVHPRLAHMLLRGRDENLAALACLLAALLEERDPLAGRGEADIELRLRALADGNGIARGARQRLLDAARQLAERLGTALDLPQALREAARAGFLLAEAYPDRIAQRRPGPEPRYRMAGGRGAELDRADPLAQSPWLAVAQVTGGGRDARIRLAAELSAEDVARLEAEAGESVELRYDGDSRAVVARRLRKVGSLVLEEHPVPLPPGRALPVLLDAIRARGIDVLPWDRSADSLRERMNVLHRIDPGAWPDCREHVLLAELGDWLAPFVQDVARLDDIAPATLRQALAFRAGPGRLRELETQAPESFALPSGRSVRIDYTGEEPVLAARIQQFFGLRETPAIAGGRLPLTLELLSPANRPMQRTRDLGSFWKNTYPEVRRDLRGRYPKHAWPEDPFSL